MRRLDLILVFFLTVLFCVLTLPESRPALQPNSAYFQSLEQVMAPDQVQRAARLFEIHCSSCHFDSGAELAVDLTDPTSYRQGAEMSQIEDVIVRRQGGADVLGSEDARLLAHFVRALQKRVPERPEHGWAVNGISLGMSRNEVEEVLGPPDASDKDSATLLLRYGDQLLVALNDRRGVVFVLGTELRGEGGQVLARGATEGELRAVFPKAEEPVLVLDLGWDHKIQAQIADGRALKYLLGLNMVMACPPGPTEPTACRAFSAP